MVILLKALSFAIWVAIMLAMIAASRYGNTSDYHSVDIYLTDEEDIEITLHKIGRHLSSRDRLIIHDAACSNNRRHQVFMKSLIKKNPSIVYYHLGQNFG